MLLVRRGEEKTRVTSCCAEKFTRYPSGHLFLERVGRPRIVSDGETGVKWRRGRRCQDERGAETFVFLRTARFLASDTIRWPALVRAPFLAGPRFSRIDGKVGLIPARDRRPPFRFDPASVKKWTETTRALSEKQPEQWRSTWKRCKLRRYARTGARRGTGKKLRLTHVRTKCAIRAERDERTLGERDTCNESDVDSHRQRTNVAN